MKERQRQRQVFIGMWHGVAYYCTRGGGGGYGGWPQGLMAVQLLGLKGTGPPPPLIMPPVMLPSATLIFFWSWLLMSSPMPRLLRRPLAFSMPAGWSTQAAQLSS